MKSDLEIKVEKCIDSSEETTMAAILINGPIPRQPSIRHFPYATIARWGTGNGWVLREVHRTEEDAENWQAAYMGGYREYRTVLRAELVLVT